GLKEELSGVLTERGRELVESAQTELLPAAKGSATRTRVLLQAVADGKPVARARLQALEKRGLIELRRVAVSARPAPDVEVAAAVPGAQPPSRAPRQAEVLAWLLARDEAGVPVEELLAAFPGSRPHLRRLVARGLATIRNEPAGPLRAPDAPWGGGALRPSPAQFAALGQLRAALESSTFAPFLLHGATGSGKTFVYMEAIARAREKGKGAIALVRAKDAGAVAVLGSATPSLETLRRAAEGKLTVLRLPERVDGRPLPAIEIVDRKQVPAGKLLTDALARALQECVARSEQAILFLNKRGQERSLLCKDCGSAVGCPNCSVALVLHRAGGTMLRCHLCGHEEMPRA